MSCKEYNDRKDGLTVDDITKPKVKQYDELLELERNKIVTNTNAFECEICLGEYNAGEGITLRDCFHVICRDCLSGTITNSNEVEIRCPMPDCENILQIIIARTAGCDWLMCTMCKTEICWITKGRRWGPNGNGDISGGCRCRVNGKMCHPKCGNCH